MLLKFSSSTKIVVSLLLLILTLFTITSMFNFFRKCQKFEIVETRYFSCPDIADFTFQYPVFRGWENISLNRELCELRIKDVSNLAYLTVQISIDKGVLLTLSNSSKKNEHGISYILDSKKEELRFMLGDKLGTGDVHIKIFRFPIKQKNKNISGFSSEQFFKMVIESFKLVREKSGNAEFNYLKTLQSIAQDIVGLKNEFPQLSEFLPSKNVENEQLIISYGYHTHTAAYHGGWTSGVPNPDDDGVWFYIDFHEADSQAQIHTQPETIAMCLGSKRVSFLMLEGQKTKSLAGRIWTVLQNHGAKRCVEP